VLPDKRVYRYLSEDRLLELSPPPHPLIIQDRLITEFESDRLAISKVISLFNVKEQPKILHPIHLFKYMGIIQIGEEFGKMLAKIIPIEDYDCMVPIPIHHARKRERGFNQSYILAKSIEKYTGIPVYDRAIVRNKYTYSQVNLSREERKSNLDKKFEVVASDLIYDKKVLLVDDVLTTASTANSCAETLLKAGARRTDVASIAVSY
jgi:ComF family protein